MGRSITASRDRHSHCFRTIEHVEDEVYLIALLPSARPIGNDEYCARFMNILSFIVLYKLDDRAGDDAYESAFSIRWDGALKLVELTIARTYAFHSHCVQRCFDLSTLRILPQKIFTGPMAGMFSLGQKQRCDFFPILRDHPQISIIMNISTVLWIALGIFFIVLIIRENREVASFKKELEEDISQKDGSKK